jgi:hypothetical protein
MRVTQHNFSDKCSGQLLMQHVLAEENLGRIVEEDENMKHGVAMTFSTLRNLILKNILKLSAMISMTMF